jgi:hypothetical protein
MRVRRTQITSYFATGGADPQGMKRSRKSKVTGYDGLGTERGFFGAKRARQLVGIPEHP